MDNLESTSEISPSSFLSYPNNERGMGYVYLVQPELYLGTNVYKVGQSSKNKRSGYGKNCILYCNVLVYRYHILEGILKTEFKMKYKLHSGSEFFYGNIHQMQIDFLQIVVRSQLSETISNPVIAIDKTSEDEDTPQLIVISSEMKFLCPRCRLLFNSAMELRIHWGKRLKPPRNKRGYQTGGKSAELHYCDLPPIETRTGKCPYCGTDYANIDNLYNQHLRRFPCKQFKGMEEYVYSIASP